MTRLRLTDSSKQVIAGWTARNADSARRRRVADVIRSLEDGSWDAPRWYYRDDIAGPGEIVMRPGECIEILFQIIDEPGGIKAVDITSIDVDERYDEPLEDSDTR